MADREPEARAASDRLRREERIEHAIAVSARDAAAGVCDLDDGPPGLVAARGHADGVPVGGALGNRLRGVEQHVDEHLTEARLVRADRRGRAVALDQARTMPELVAGDLRGEFEDAIDLDCGPVIFVGARERHQAAHDGADSLDGYLRVAQRRIAVARHQDLEVGRDRRERIVDLVRDTAGERADRQHAIREHQARRDLLGLGDILRHTDQANELTILEGAAVRSVDRAHLAIRAPDAVLGALDVAGVALAPVAHVGLHDRLVVVVHALDQRLERRRHLTGRKAEQRVQSIGPRHLVRREIPLPHTEVSELLRRGEEALGRRSRRRHDPASVQYRPSE